MIPPTAARARKVNRPNFRSDLRRRVLLVCAAFAARLADVTDVIVVISTLAGAPIKAREHQEPTVSLSGQGGEWGTFESGWWRCTEVIARLDRDEGRSAEDERLHGGEVRDSEGRRRDERLLGTAGAASVTLRSRRQLAIAESARGFSAADDEEIQEQADKQRRGHDAAVAQRKGEQS
jgi:hypothetical protein